MSRKNLWIGIGYMLCGLLFLAAAILSKDKISSLFAGLSGGGLGGGIALLSKYFYWSRAERIVRYRERMEAQDIEMKDERNILFRDKAGRYTYILSLVIISISILVFTVIDAMNLYKCKLIILYLSLLLIFLYAAGFFIYKRLKAQNA